MFPWTILLATLFLQASSIDGVVRRADTGEPVSKAVIELRNEDGGVQTTVLSRSDGRFTIGAVPAGRFRIAVKRPGYVATEYGKRREAGRGTIVDVSTGTSLRDVQIMMTPTGAVYGRVYDVSGRPFVKATVRAYRRTYQNGGPSLAEVQSALTNDLGEYRLFWLTPGTYYVGATVPNWSISGDTIMLNASAPAVPGAVIGSRYVLPARDPIAMPPLNVFGATADRFQTVYFPNTIEQSAAQPIAVAAAGEYGGIDILLAPVRTRRLRGVVVDGSTGEPVPLVQVVGSPSAQGTGAERTNASGEFTLQTLTEEVFLTAIASPRSGRVIIPFGDVDIDGIRIPVLSGYDIPGQVLVDDSPSAAGVRADVSSLRITLRPEPVSVFMPVAGQVGGTPTETGAFTVQNVIPGDYRVNVLPLFSAVPPTNAPAVPPALQKAYIKAIQYGRTDALNGPFRLAGSPEDSLTIVIGTDPGTVSGLAFGPDRQSFSDATVVLVPAVLRGRADLYRSAVTDSEGTFRIENVPPGDYVAFAWADVENGSWQDPAFLRDSESRGVPVKVAPSGTLEIRLAVIE